MITLTETYEPKIGDKTVNTRQFPTRQAFKKALRMAPIKTEVTYALMKHGRYDELLADGRRTMIVEEHPKLEIVK